MRRHRDRTRGIANRLTRIIAVVSLVVWGGLLLGAMFNWNNSPSGETEQQATRSESGQRAAAQSDQEPVRVAEDNNDEQRARDGNTNPDPAELHTQSVVADNRQMAAASAPPRTAGDELNSDKPAAIAWSPTGTPPETAAESSPAVRSDASAEPQMIAARPARQRAAAGANAITESDMARFETAPEEPEASTSVSSEHVARAQFTTRIEAREPVDRVGAVFPSNGQSLRTLFYFTEIIGLNGETLTHRWEHEGQVAAEVSFDIGSDRWRAYSSKDLNQGMKGKWRVVVTDSNGEIIKIDSFAYDES